MEPKSPSKKQKDDVQNECKTRNHTPNPLLSCPQCYIKSLNIQKTRRNQCIRKKHTTRKITDTSQVIGCEPCELKLKKKLEKLKHSRECREGCPECVGRDRCSHSNTELLTRLDPIMYSVVVYDNIKKRGEKKKLTKKKKF